MVDSAAKVCSFCKTPFKEIRLISAPSRNFKPPTVVYGVAKPYSIIKDENPSVGAFLEPISTIAQEDSLEHTKEPYIPSHNENKQKSNINIEKNQDTLDSTEGQENSSEHEAFSVQSTDKLTEQKKKFTSTPEAVKRLERLSKMLSSQSPYYIAAFEIETIEIAEIQAESAEELIANEENNEQVENSILVEEKPGAEAKEENITNKVSDKGPLSFDLSAIESLSVPEVKEKEVAEEKTEAREQPSSLSELNDLANLLSVEKAEIKEEVKDATKLTYDLSKIQEKIAALEGKPFNLRDTQVLNNSDLLGHQAILKQFSGKEIFLENSENISDAKRVQLEEQDTYVSPEIAKKVAEEKIEHITETVVEAPKGIFDHNLLESLNTQIKEKNTGTSFPPPPPGPRGSTNQKALNHYNNARDLCVKGNYPKALEELETSVSADPAFEQAHILLSRTFLKLKSLGLIKN